MSALFSIVLLVGVGGEGSGGILRGGRQDLMSGLFGSSLGFAIVAWPSLRSVYAQCDALYGIQEGE